MLRRMIGRLGFRVKPTISHIMRKHRENRHNCTARTGVDTVPETHETSEHNRSTNSRPATMNTAQSSVYQRLQYVMRAVSNRVNAWALSLYIRLLIVQWSLEEKTTEGLDGQRARP